MAIDINYKGKNIASLGDIKTAVIECAGKKMTDDLTIVVTDEGGDSKCSGKHVIEVEELPTENIDTTVLYRCGDSYHQYAEGAFKDIIIVSGGDTMSLVDFYVQYGMTIELYQIRTKPTTEEELAKIVVSDVNAGNIAMYYIEDEADVSVYDGTTWEALGATGVIGDISEATADGAYILGGSSWTKYVAPSGSIEITEVGKYDVTTKESVILSVDNLTPINIEEGITILGVTGIFGTDKDGLFDNAGTHLASYETLVNDYGLNIEKDYSNSNYATEASSITYILNNNSEFADATAFIIPEHITSIGDYAFSNNDKLTGVIITNGVASIGFHAFSNCTNLVSVIIPDSVTSIDSYAFQYCSNLTSITIPDSVTSIGNRAFYGCSGIIQSENGVEYVDRWVVDCDSDVTTAAFRENTIGVADDVFSWHDNITNIAVPASTMYIGDGAFSSCRSLTTVTFGENSQLTTIGNNAFDDCSNLTSIIIPDTVTTIGNYAFDDCSGLVNVTLSSSITTIGEHTFYDCGFTSISIPSSVTSIGRDAFYSCNNLTSIIFEENSQLTSIGDSAFGYCNSLTSITIPEGVTYIGGGAFSMCSALTDVNIPDMVTTIGRSAFYNCVGLTSITIPQNVATVGEDAFKECSNITTVNTTSLANWYSIEFGNVYANPTYYTNSLYVNNELITEFTIPEGVTSIGSYSLACFSNITNLIIPDSVMSIGFGALLNCSNLESITIPFVGDVKDNPSNDHFGHIFGASTSRNNYEHVPESLKTVVITGGASIGFYAFDDCDGITTIIIPNSVTRIASGAFTACDGITSIDIPASVTDIGSSAFFGCDGLTSIVIPDSVTNIGSQAFAYCPGIKTITFTGTVAQWNAITKGTELFVGVPTAKVICSDGEVAL